MNDGGIIMVIIWNGYMLFNCKIYIMCIRFNFLLYLVGFFFKNWMEMFIVFKNVYVILEFMVGDCYSVSFYYILILNDG